MGQCYGFFEIPSVTAAIDAVDIMCKTADVEMITWEKKLGGRLVTIIIRGDVSAVTQAIEAADPYSFFTVCKQFADVVVLRIALLVVVRNKLMCYPVEPQ